MRFGISARPYVRQVREKGKVKNVLIEQIDEAVKKSGCDMKSLFRAFRRDWELKPKWICDTLERPGFIKLDRGKVDSKENEDEKESRV